MRCDHKRCNADGEKVLEASTVGMELSLSLLLLLV